MTQLSELESAAVNAWAKREGRTRSAMARRLLGEAIQVRRGSIPVVDEVGPRADPGHAFEPQAGNALKCEWCGMKKADHR